MVDIMAFALYIHIPFCLHKCPYCDFASGPADPSLFGPYVKAVCQEMSLRRGTAAWPTADTLYLGGGTPSLLAPAQVGELIATARHLYALTDDAEITLEANPGSVDEVSLAAYRDARVNRLSLGVQSFDDRHLSFLGRIHSSAEARRAFHAARAAGFDNIGIDLIHSLPDQSLHDWQETLEKAVALSPEHISAYALTLEEGTPLADAHQRGEFTLPAEDTAGLLYSLTTEVLSAAGYEQYEVANFARPGHRSRHNQADPRAYLAAVEAGRLPEAERAPLTPREAMAEWLFLSLRTSDGFLPGDFSATFGLSLHEACDGAIPRLLEQGLLRGEEGRIRLSPAALPVANQIFLHFV
jgi:oxygen-independent coproporphyrinogen-3 oxidase